MMKRNQHIKCLGRKSFISTVIISHTDRHASIALPGPQRRR